MQNGASLSLFPAPAPPGRTITLGGAGILNQNTLTLATGAAGTSGTLNVNGGTNDASGTLAVGADWTMNIAPGTTLTNAGGITSTSANGHNAPVISGGSITNTGTLSGSGTVSSAVVNQGLIEGDSGTLSLSGTVSNPASGIISAPIGATVTTTSGMAVNDGLIRVTDGSFIHNGDLQNNGTINVRGTFTNANGVIKNNNTIAFFVDSSTLNHITNVSARIENENGHVVQIHDVSVFDQSVTNYGGTFDVSTTSSGDPAGKFLGGLSISPVDQSNAPVGPMIKVGTGTLTVAPTPGNTVTLANNSQIAVQVGTMIFNVSGGGGGGAGRGGGRPFGDTGDVSVGSGVTAAVSSGATLMLLGSESNLSSGNNVVNVANDGVLSVGGMVGTSLVPATNQDLGHLTHHGSLYVAPGSTAKVDSIVQDMLIIDGDVNNHGFVTINATDASGNPQNRVSSLDGLAAAGALAPSAPMSLGDSGAGLLGGDPSGRAKRPANSANSSSRVSAD
jgi:hypothetical protein